MSEDIQEQCAKTSTQVLYDNLLSLDSVNAILRNEISVLCIRNYFNYSNIPEILMRIKNISTSSYSHENNLVNHIGQSSYEIDGDIEKFESYYKGVNENITQLNKLFSPYPTPVRLFLDDLNRLWAEGIVVDKLHEKKMFAGIIRTIRKNSEVHAHQDLVKWSNSKAINISDVEGQFGLNYFLQVPSVGGHLMVWNQELEYEEFNKRSKGFFCIPLEEMPPPDWVVKPEVGMLILLNSRNLHAIEKSISCDRIALSFFVAYRGKNKPITIWS